MASLTSYALLINIPFAGVTIKQRVKTLEKSSKLTTQVQTRSGQAGKCGFSHVMDDFLRTEKSCGTNNHRLYSSVAERWSCKPKVMSSILIGGIYFALCRKNSSRNFVSFPVSTSWSCFAWFQTFGPFNWLIQGCLNSLQLMIIFPFVCLLCALCNLLSVAVML